MHLEIKTRRSHASSSHASAEIRMRTIATKILQYDHFNCCNHWILLQSDWKILIVRDWTIHKSHATHHMMTFECMLLVKKLNSTHFNLCHIFHSVSNQFCNQLIEVCFVAWFFVIVITGVAVMLVSLIDQCSNGKSYITWLSFLTNQRTLFSIQAFYCASL